jgi:hypothetical protein
MAIPKINLIPPAYYEHKQVKRTTIMAVVAILVLVGAMVAFALSERAAQEDLIVQQNAAQQRVDAIQQMNQQAEQIRTGVQEEAAIVTFVSDVYESNRTWATVFEGIARYTYPRVRYASIDPQPNTANLQLQILVPVTADAPPQLTLNRYWANLLRSPLIQTALPGEMVGWSPRGTDAGAAGGAMPMMGPQMPGAGPPMGPPMGPGMGPPMGPMTGPADPLAAPTPAWIGSPGQLAAGALDPLGAQQQQLGLALGETAPMGRIPTEAEILQRLRQQAAQQVPIRPFTIAATMTRTLTIPQPPTAAAAPVDDFAF